MSNEKKPSTDELYARSQWSDNMSFSRKAMDESKKKSGHLHEEPPTEQPQENRSPGTRPLEAYVDDMNHEIHRMSDAVENRLEEVGGKLSRSFKRLASPLSKSVDNASEGIKTMRDGIGKAMLNEFTSVVRNVGDRLGSVKGETPKPQTEHEAPPPGPDGKQPQKVSLKPMEAPKAIKQPSEAPSDTAQTSGTAALNAASDENIRQFDTDFGTLLEHKIFFSTIHNRPFLNERDIKAFNPEDRRLMMKWMERGVEEIRNCAPYGQKLPTPTKGRFTDVPMHEILHTVTLDDLERFLSFVLNRPQPFRQKALKLSEAFATWAHKGAPEQ